jgi:hypothetical protein
MVAMPRAGLLETKPHLRSGDPVWLDLYRGGGVKRILIFRNRIFSLKNPSKSILTLKIVKPFSRKFLKS